MYTEVCAQMSLAVWHEAHLVCCLCLLCKRIIELWNDFWEGLATSHLTSVCLSRVALPSLAVFALRDQRKIQPLSHLAWRFRNWNKQSSLYFGYITLSTTGDKLKAYLIMFIKIHCSWLYLQQAHPLNRPIRGTLSPLLNCHHLRWLLEEISLFMQLKQISHPLLLRSH